MYHHFSSVESHDFCVGIIEIYPSNYQIFHGIDIVILDVCYVNVDFLGVLIYLLLLYRNSKDYWYLFYQAF